MNLFNRVTLVVLLLSFTMLFGCQDDLVPRDTPSLLIPRFLRSEIFGFVAGFGTTFAAVPDLSAMLRSRSEGGRYARMGAMMAVVQLLREYYALLPDSRLASPWTALAVV